MAELQNDCSKRYKISPDETLKDCPGTLREKAGHLSENGRPSAVNGSSKEIHKNIRGLSGFANVQSYAAEVLEGTAWKKIASTRYVNDKQITDHYAIIPTGQGLLALRGVSALSVKVYELIARRFLSIFYPPAIYQKTTLVSKVQQESFFSSFRLFLSEGIP
ncbi:MAG: DNA topoisomerase [Lachnospiraceae bacterium]